MFLSYRMHAHMQDADLFQQTSKVLTVAELTRSIRGALETKFRAVWVQGEISNYKLHPSGHQYFTLKDQRAQIACVIWRDTIAPPRQPLVDGSQVQVYGTVTVFEARGQYQLNVQILQPRGVGLLQAKFEALKRKLEAEGLFAAGTQTPIAEISAAHWNRNVTNRRSDSRYAERATPSRAVVADSDQPRPRPGNRRRTRNRCRHPRTRSA